MKQNIDHVVEAAQKGGSELSRLFGEELRITQKSMAADVVTEADHSSEKAILAILQKHFPDYSIVSEETGIIEKGSEFRFIIDPLDGSHNFVIGIPNFAVSIALQQNERTIASVVHQPILKKTVVSKVDEGVRINDAQVTVNSEATLKKATVSHIRNYIASTERTNALYCALSLRNVKRFLAAWSPAWDFALLASGKIEAIILDITTEKEIYDYAAGKLFVREAGGRITDFAGNDDTSDTNSRFIASNGTALHDTLVSVLEECGYS